MLFIIENSRIACSKLEQFMPSPKLDVVQPKIKPVKLKSQRENMISEGRQHKFRQKRRASVANYPFVLFIIENSRIACSKLEQFMPSPKLDVVQPKIKPVKLKSQRENMISEGRQHKFRQKRRASVANYPFVLFIIENSRIACSKLEQFMPSPKLDVVQPKIKPVKLKSQRENMISEGRQHKFRQKRRASVANYPFVLFIIENSRIACSKLEQFMPSPKLNVVQPKIKPVKLKSQREYDLRRKAAQVSSEAKSFSCKLPMCALHH